MIPHFARLGRLVADRWAARHHDFDAFADIALAACNELPPARHVTPAEVARYVLSARELPEQLDPASRFGQPPVTVYRHDQFVIDVLFWIDGTTSIHQHGFSGAFHVMAGSSIHSQYTFRERQRVNRFLRLGDIALASIELLRAGETRAAPEGGQFIHSLFHLDRPSLSVVIRTLNNPGGELQYDYFKPHVALYPERKSVAQQRQIEIVAMLFDVGDKTRVAMLRRALDGADLVTSYLLLDAVAARPGDSDALDGALALARRRHGAAVDLFPPVFAEKRRQADIIGRRKLIRDPEHRFFLALLLNAPRRDDILELITRRFPRVDPCELVMKWTAQLAEQRAGETSVLGLNLDETSLVVFRLLLEGLSPAELIARLKREYRSDQVEAQRAAIDEMTRGLRESLFRPLFADAKRAPRRRR